MPGPERFPQRERLTRQRDYLFIYRHGRKRVGDAFICYVVRRTGQGRKMGSAVSRKVGSAVVRNRVKRYIREIYRKHRGLMPEDAHLVVVARPASAGLDYPACEARLCRLLQPGDATDA